MLHSRLPLHHRSPQLSSSCPLRFSSRTCPLSAHYCITAFPSRRSLFACCAKKEEGKADGRDGKPSWAHLWTSSQDTTGKQASQPSSTSSGSSRPSPLPSRERNSSNTGRKDSPSRAGSQDAQGKEAPQPSTPSRENSRPFLLPSSERYSNIGSKDSTSRSSRSGSQSAQGKGTSEPSPPSSRSSRPSPLPFKGRSRSADSTDSTSRAAGSQEARSSSEASCPSPPSRRSSSGRTSAPPPPPPPSRPQNSISDSERRHSRAGGPPRQDQKPKRQHAPSSNSSSSSSSSSSRSSSSWGSSSSSRGNERDPEQSSSKRFRGSRDSRPGRPTKGVHLDLGSCLQRAHNAVHPWQCSKVLLDLENCVRQDKHAVLRYSKEHPCEIEAAADALTAALLGSSSGGSFSSSSSSSMSSSNSKSTMAVAPFQKLDSKQLCLSVSGFAALADCNSSSIRTSQLHQLVDGIAVHVVWSNILDQPADMACMQWARLLYNVAKLGIKCRDSQPVQRLFDVAAQKFPHMLRQGQPCEPQSVSNTLWAFATAEYPGSLRGLVAEVAHNEAQAMENAKPQGWSDTLWALGTMADRSVDLGDRTSLDAIMGAGAASMEQLSSRSEPGYISRSIWGMAKADYRPHDSIISKLATAVAERSIEATPQALSNSLWALAQLGCEADPSTIRKLATAMAEQKDAEPQALSNTLWGLAKLGSNLDPSTVSKLAAAVAESSRDAKPQELSNTLWALATLDRNPGASTVSKLADAVADCSSDATPQALSNTLWAVAKLDCDPSASTVIKLASALAEHVSDADPQALSNTLWALAELGWYDAHQISEMVAAFVQHQNDPANPAQHFSNVLQALGEMRWYDAARYSQLVEGVLLKISSSSPEEVGQQLSNSMFSCALSCHFDSSVDELAEWGSKQSLQRWTGQEVSNALYAWAVLSATAEGDTASMRRFARHLFSEASSRGVAAFQARSEWRHDMGKLFSAHQEALHVCVPEGGVSDGELLRLAQEDTEQFQRGIDTDLSHMKSAVSAELQGVYEVQSSTIEGYNALLVHHPSCPRGIALEITHPFRAYLRHPSDRVYGKTALRQEQMKRICDGAVVCDGSEVRGKSGEQLREMLVQRIEQAARD